MEAQRDGAAHQALAGRTRAESPRSSSDEAETAERDTTRRRQRRRRETTSDSEADSTDTPPESDVAEEERLRQQVMAHMQLQCAAYQRAEEDKHVQLEAMLEELSTEEVDAMVAQGDQAACMLCLDSPRRDQCFTRLPCGHVFHGCGPLPPEHELPRSAQLQGHQLKLICFTDLLPEEYWGGWVCDVCGENKFFSTPLYHDQRPPEGLSGGFDACVRCAIKSDPQVAVETQAAKRRRRRIEALANAGERISRCVHRTVSFLRRQGIVGMDESADAGVSRKGFTREELRDVRGLSSAELRAEMGLDSIGMDHRDERATIDPVHCERDWEQINMLVESGLLVAHCDTDRDGLNDRILTASATANGAGRVPAGGPHVLRYSFNESAVTRGGDPAGCLGSTDLAESCAGVERWLESKGTCPACRAKVLTWPPQQHQQQQLAQAQPLERSEQENEHGEEQGHQDREGQEGGTTRA